MGPAAPGPFGTLPGPMGPAARPLGSISALELVFWRPGVRAPRPLRGPGPETIVSVVSPSARYCKKDSTKIDTFQRKFLRQIIRNRRTKNIHLYRICNTTPWTLQIKERRLKWFGHLQRLPKEAPARVAYEEVNNKPVKKVRGGQPLTWQKTIEKDLKVIGINLQTAVQKSQDRDLYQKLVARAMDEAQEKISPDGET